MTSIRTALCLSLPIIIALIFAGCSPASPSSGDLDTRTGCAIVTAKPTMVGSQVVMDLRATGCHGPDGRPLSRDDAVDRLAQAMWHSLRLPVDAVRIRALESAEEYDGRTTVVTSEELEARFGPGPSGVVWPATAAERGSGDGIWFLIPVVYLVAGLGIVWLARCMLRAGIVVIYFRR
ncbi:hypothetical protein ACVGOW_19530 [Pseudonocardia saturnea]